MGVVEMSSHPTPDQRRLLPSVDRMLQEEAVRRLVELYGREPVLVQVRRQLDRLRSDVAQARAEELSAAIDRLPEAVAQALAEGVGRRLRRVLNATGVFLHTNLGRAPLPRAVARGLPALLEASCDLEFDIETGRRGERNRRALPLLRALVGAEAGLVANNNAAALMLALATLAKDREVVVSRGELVEIGGSFRIPEIMAAAGARLVEVGTTNRTRLADYASAVGPETALLLKVHPSNYRITGFAESVQAASLAQLGRDRGVPVLVDEGAGLLRPSAAPQLRDHPSIAQLLAAGVDLVSASGDKLLGGPQAGLLVGEGELVERCRRNPLYRAVRPDRATFAALEEVLRWHLSGRELPLDRMWVDPDRHLLRLEAAARRLGAQVVSADAYLGGGAAPEAAVPGQALALSGDQALLRRLRSGEPPVVGYLKGGRLILDLRTVDPSDDGELIAAVCRALEEPSLS
jgi:L-seryl-tRNA(Ser) seleniumtransferase